MEVVILWLFGKPVMGSSLRGRHEVRDRDRDRNRRWLLSGKQAEGAKLRLFLKKCCFKRWEGEGPERRQE